LPTLNLLFGLSRRQFTLACNRKVKLAQGLQSQHAVLRQHGPDNFLGAMVAFTGTAINGIDQNIGIQRKALRETLIKSSVRGELVEP